MQTLRLDVCIALCAFTVPKIFTAPDVSREKFQFYFLVVFVFVSFIIEFGKSSEKYDCEMIVKERE